MIADPGGGIRRIGQPEGRVLKKKRFGGMGQDRAPASASDFMKASGMIKMGVGDYNQADVARTNAAFFQFFEKKIRLSHGTGIHQQIALISRDQIGACYAKPDF